MVKRKKNSSFHKSLIIFSCIKTNHNYDMALTKSNAILYENILTTECGSYYNDAFNNTEVGLYDLEKNTLIWHPNKIPGRLLYDENWKNFIQNYHLIT